MGMLLLIIAKHIRSITSQVTSQRILSNCGWLIDAFIKEVFDTISNVTFAWPNVGCQKNYCLISIQYMGYQIPRRIQRAKEVVSDSPASGFCYRASDILLLTCPTGKWSFCRYSNYRVTVKSILLIKMYSGLVEVRLG